MKVRETKNGVDGKLLVFPEGHEFRAFKRWWLEFGKSAEDYYDSTAGCYVVRSATVKDLEEFGFKVTSLSRRQYSKIVREALAEGYYREEGD
jgi:hypothetical protein